MKKERGVFMFRLSTAQISRIGLFTALTIIMSQISIPMPYGVPMTMQTFIIPLVAFLLGKKEGTYVSIIYMILGLVGLPVFAGFTGGLSIILGPTGGFILSFPLMAYCSGIASEKESKISVISWLVIGAILNYLVGMFYFSLMTSSTLMVAFTACVLPFIPTAIIKIVLVYFVGEKLKKLNFKKIKA